MLQSSTPTQDDGSHAECGLEQERARQDLERVHLTFGPAAPASLFEHNDLPASGATDEPTKWSFEDELKRLL